MNSWWLQLWKVLNMNSAERMIDWRQVQRSDPSQNKDGAKMVAVRVDTKPAEAIP